MIDRIRNTIMKQTTKLHQSIMNRSVWVSGISFILCSRRLGNKNRLNNGNQFHGGSCIYSSISRWSNRILSSTDSAVADPSTAEDEIQIQRKIEDADRETALFVNGYSLKKGLSRQKEVLFVLFANGYYSIPWWLTWLPTDWVKSQ